MAKRETDAEFRARKLKELQEEQQRLWDECDESEKDASEWEGRFLENIKGQVDHGLILSPKQAAMLREIHEKLCG